MMYRDIFIDFDDTLYATHDNAVVALRELYVDMDLDGLLTDEAGFYDEYWSTNIELWGQYSRGEISRDFLIVERFRRPLSRFARDADPRWLNEAFCLRVSDRFLHLCSLKTAVIPGAHELIEYLKGKGYRLHLCSNGFHEVQYRKLEACGLSGMFDNVILSEDAGANKPSRVFFDYALEKCGAERCTTLMIGDNYDSDIVGAMNSGIDALLFNHWGYRDLPRQPKFVVDSLLDIMSVI